MSRKRYVAEVGYDPVEILESKLKNSWGKSEKTKNVQMPIFFRASRKPV